MTTNSERFHTVVDATRSVRHLPTALRNLSDALNKTIENTPGPTLVGPLDPRRRKTVRINAPHGAMHGRTGFLIRDEGPLAVVEIDGREYTFEHRMVMLRHKD